MFIALAKIGQLDLLHIVYGTIQTTPEVAVEFGEPFPEWVIIQQVQDISRQRLLELQVDKGEASAIALALETPTSTLIIDDYRGRKTAEFLGIKYTGTIGVIIKAKLTGNISSIKPIMAKIRSAGFWIGEEIEQQALIHAGE